jgi:hypothetical protein
MKSMVETELARCEPPPDQRQSQPSIRSVSDAGQARTCRRSSRREVSLLICIGLFPLIRAMVSLGPSAFGPMTCGDTGRPSTGPCLIRDRLNDGSGDTATTTVVDHAPGYVASSINDVG